MRPVALVVAAIAAVVASAAPFTPGRDFLVPSVDFRRNGLSNEQYAQIAAIRRRDGRPMVMNPDDAAEMVYRAERGRNIEGWLEDVGRTNDYARLLIPTMETNLVLVATNRALVAEASGLRARLEVAEPEALLALRVKEALVAEGTLGPYLRTELVALRESTSDPRKREVFDACIALIDSAVNGVSEDRK